MNGCTSRNAVDTTAIAQPDNTQACDVNAALEIDLTDPIDLEFWALVFMVSVASVRQSAEFVGVQYDAVAAHLRSNTLNLY